MFAEGWNNQESTITVERTGGFSPTPAELAAMETSKPPKVLAAGAAAMAVPTMPEDEFVDHCRALRARLITLV